MSDKMTCPGCEAHTSSVLGAVQRGDPCPYCGLSAASITELAVVWEKVADEQMQRRWAELFAERDELVRELREARIRLTRVRTALDEAVGDGF